ncbi:MAG: M10 family metallopeptidase [Pseudomonadota bacterium]
MTSREEGAQLILDGHEPEAGSRCGCLMCRIEHADDAEGGGRDVLNSNVAPQIAALNEHVDTPDAAEGTWAEAIAWGTKIDVSGSRTLSYYFSETGERWDGLNTFTWYDYEKDAMRDALDAWADVTNIQFEETANDSSADLVFGLTPASSWLGYYNPPGTSGGGIGMFNYLGYGWDENALEQGGFGFITLIHELGHALGLAHPHDTGGTSTVAPGVRSAFQDYGKHDLNQGIYTTMSYNDGWAERPTPSKDYGYQGTPMPFDIHVIQELYGARDARTGDSIYRLPDSNGEGTFFSTIWDTGGSDVISNGGSDRDTVIDLRDATLKNAPGGGGYVSAADGIYGGFLIAHGVMIEHAKGGGGNDSLVGNEAHNTLTGRGGKDTLLGRTGQDTLTGDGGGDLLRGGKGADDLKGGSGADETRGGRGEDRLEGGDGDDAVFGGRGADRLFGQGGDDVLTGGAGGDDLTGGGGADRFRFGKGFGNDTITDFQDGRDVLDLRLLSKTSKISDLVIRDRGADVLIKTDHGTILLEDLDRSDLGDSDFLF